MADINADEFSSSGMCVLERSHIEKFRETQQEAIVNLLEGKDVLVSQPTASEKFVIFSPSRSCCVDESDLLVILWLPLCSTRLSRTAPGSIAIQATFIGDEQNDESVTRNIGVESGLFHVSFTDGYPYLQVQLTGKLQKA